MENWKSLYDRNFNIALKKLESDYEEDIDKAGNVEFMHNEFKNSVIKEYNRLCQNDYLPYKGQIFTIIRDIEDMYKRDKTPFNKAYEQITSGYSSEDKNIIIKKISKIEAYSKFYNEYLPYDVIKAATETGEFLAKYIAELLFKSDEKDLDEIVKVYIEKTKNDIIIKLKEFKTTAEQYDFLKMGHEKIRAEYFPVKLENKFYNKEIEVKVKEIFQKTDELYCKIIDEFKIFTSNETEQINSLQKVEKNGATIRLQVLAIYYLLKDHNVWANTDKTAIARFTQFLTGKQIANEEIKNTNIYKFVLNPLKSNEKGLNQDLASIRVHFQNLGMTDIVASIDKEKNSGK